MAEISPDHASRKTAKEGAPSNPGLAPRATAAGSFVWLASSLLVLDWAT